MAIVNSLGIGRGKKSAGNLTYRTVRGRCIASQRREKMGAQSGAPSIAQAKFSLISSFMRAHASDIDVSFSKSTYGSQRNNFYRKNKAGLEAALQTLASTYSTTNQKPSVAEIDEAIATYAEANPTAIVRVYLSGFDTVYLTGAWSSDDNPVAGGGVNELGRGTATVAVDGETYDGKVACSLNFYSGAKIVREAGTATITCKGLPAGIQAAQIKYLDGSGSPIADLSVTSVTSSVAGKIVFAAPAIAAEKNAVAMQVGSVFVRLTSAYVYSGGEGGSPL